jgi:hypothetical protein
MWGGGDLVKLVIQAGNDVRAQRILLARLVHRTPALPGEDRVEERVENTPDAESAQVGMVQPAGGPMPGSPTARR